MSSVQEILLGVPVPPELPLNRYYYDHLTDGCAYGLRLEVQATSRDDAVCRLQEALQIQYDLWALKLPAGVEGTLYFYPHQLDPKALGYGGPVE